MSNSSEDNLLDQSLRDVFRDYDLPPDAHPRVWKGVASRIATHPATGTGLAYRLLLPLMAVVGVGIGWLLPHPEALPATRPAAAVHTVAPAPAVTVAAAATPLQPVSAAAEARSVAQLVARPQPAARKRRATAQNQPASPEVSASPAGLDSVSIAAVQAAVTPEVVVPADSAPSVAAPLAHAPVPQASAPAQQVASSIEGKTLKPAGTNEKIGYKKLSQRQSEGRRGIGRWFTRFFQGVRHLLS